MTDCVKMDPLFVARDGFTLNIDMNELFLDTALRAAMDGKKQRMKVIMRPGADGKRANFQVTVLSDDEVVHQVTDF